MKAKIEQLPSVNRGIEVTSETDEEKQHLENLWTRRAAAVVLSRNDGGSVTITFGPTDEILKPVNDLSRVDIIEMRRKAGDEASQAVKWMPWLSGKVPIRVGSAIRRSYRAGYLTKPINELTDDELLRVRGIWTKSLEQIRQAIKLKEA